MEKLIQALFLFLAITCYPQSRAYSEKTELAMETYAFLEGQRFALETIKGQFPSLRHDIRDIELADSVFGRSLRNIELILKGEMTEAAFAGFTAGIDQMLKDQYPTIARKSQALRFLKEARNRLEGKMKPGIWHQILAFAYADAPHLEFTSGHLQAFDTKNHPKARGASLKLAVPKSWYASEPGKTETIQQFTSFCGKGDGKILVLIYDLPKKDFLDKTPICDMIPPETKLLRSGAVTIDGGKGVLTETEEVFDKNGEKMKIRMYQYMFEKNKKLYCIQGSVGPVSSSENLENSLKIYEPLFRQVAGSARTGH